MCGLWCTDGDEVVSLQIPLDLRFSSRLANKREDHSQTLQHRYVFMLRVKVKVLAQKFIPNSESTSTHSPHLQHFHFNGSNGILNPLADFGMSVLLHGIIVLARLDEGSLRIDVSLVQNRMNCNGQEVDISRYNSLVCVQHRCL